MDEQRIRDIAAICLALRKRADFFLNTEPENLSTEDLDMIAQELEELAQGVDGLLDGLVDCAGENNSES